MPWEACFGAGGAVTGLVVNGLALPGPGLQVSEIKNRVEDGNPTIPFLCRKRPIQWKTLDEGIRLKRGVLKIFFSHIVLRFVLSISLVAGCQTRSCKPTERSLLIPGSKIDSEKMCSLGRILKHSLGPAEAPHGSRYSYGVL